MKMIRHVHLIWLALLVVWPFYPASADDDTLPPPVQIGRAFSESILRVNSTNQVYDAFHPWKKKPPFSRRGIGAALDGGRILVTAELVANSTFIELEKPTSVDKTPASIEKIDYDSNLAVLRPKDISYLSGMQPLSLNGPLKVGDEATVLQLEANGDTAQTVGKITSISVSNYPSESVPLLLVKLGAPLQQRDGSFTLPVIRQGRLEGMLMRYDPRNQSADIIPTPVIRHFLAGLNSTTNGGFARLGLSFAPLRDPQLRRHIALEEPGGIYITDIAPRSSADSAGLKKGDAILAVDRCPIDQDGNYEDPDFGRILFSHYTNTIKQPGDVISLKILRDGKMLNLPVTMQVPDREDAPSAPHLGGEAPRYVILGGLVFIELSRPYLKEWGGKWTSTAPQRLVYYDAFQNELPPDRGRIIILSRVLPSPDTVGYEDLENLVVTQVNGRTVKSLADLAEAAKNPVDGFQKIEFEEDPNLLFLDAASIEKNADTLKKHYSLPALERL